MVWGGIFNCFGVFLMDVGGTCMVLVMFFLIILGNYLDIFCFTNGKPYLIHIVVMWCDLLVLLEGLFLGFCSIYWRGS